MLLTEAEAHSITELIQLMKDCTSSMTDKEIFNALNILYSYQTEFEQDNDITFEKNGKGFNAYDVKYLTSLRNWYVEHKFYTPKQRAAAKARIRRYSKQLINYWIDNDAIHKVNDRLYTYTSKAEKLAKRREMRNMNIDQNNMFYDSDDMNDYI